MHRIIDRLLKNVKENFMRASVDYARQEITPDA